MTIIFDSGKSKLQEYDFENEELIDCCINDIKDKLLDYPNIKIYGKECIQHRSIGFFSNDSIGYKYSGQMAHSQELNENTAKLLNDINIIFNSDYNGILVNKYENGLDYIGAHSDDESGLSSIGVLALSYGATRKFRIRNKTDKKIVIDIPLTSYKIIHMGGDFQKEYTHEIPIERKVKEVRYSFTFRKHLI